MKADRRQGGWHPAALICSLLLVKCCVFASDANDDYSAADAAYEGESNSVLDLIETSEGKDAPATAAPGKQVKIVGDTSIMATLRTFGEGGNLLEITDEASGHGMVFGTNTEERNHMRIKPTKGGGIAMNSAKDKVGVFVDAETGNVGIGHSQPKAELHVEGTAYASGPIEAAGGGDKAPLQLSGVSDYHGIQFGRDGKGLYVIGRGKSVEDREMSFHIPSTAEYGGGKKPKFRWVSGQQHTTLAHLEAETGNMYFKGKVGIGSMEPKSELDVRGGINIQNQRGDAVITFPKGDGSGFHIKSTDTPAQTTDSDSRFYISGKNGYTGISTTEPKAMLDVRGSMNLQDSTGGAAIYFPDKDKTGSFYIRCADDPAKYDKSQERFYVGANGMVGIGTSKPTHGLTLDTPHPLGSKQNDIAIKKGSLRLGGAIYDSSSGDKYFIDLKKNSFIKRMAVETSIGVGTKKPISMAGSSAVIHVADPVAPLVRIENSASGAAVLELQSGESKWSVTGTGGFFKISHDSKAHFTITDDGKIGVGSAKPTHGFTVASEHPVGHPANDMSIEKGNLWLGGEIKQLEKPEYSLSLDKANRVKDMSVMGKMGVGLAKDKKPKFDLELGVNKVMSLGNQMFFSSEAGSGYMSSNLFRKGEKWELSTKDAGGAVVSLKAGGEIEIAGTLKKGSPALTTMMKISAAAQTASFPMPGLKTGFGTASPEYPIHVVGATKVGDAAASIAFGESESSMGFLGANKKYVFMGTKDGQEVLSLDQATGNVGIGTTSPQSMLHIANDQGPSMSFGSAQAKDTRAYIKAETTADGVNMVMGVNNPDQGQNTLTFDFSNTVTFGGKGATVFDRGDTVFKSGNVGIGGDTFDPEYKLHVKGDAKIEGRCFVAKKRPGPPAPAAAPAAATTTDKASSPIDHLDFTDLLEEDEVDQPQYDTHIDLVDTMEKLSKVLRKQLKQMDAHDARIGALTEQLEMLTRTKH